MIKSVGISASSNGHSDEALIETSRRIEEAGGPEVWRNQKWSGIFLTASEMNCRLSLAAV